MHRLFFQFSDLLTRVTSLALSGLMMAMATLGFYQVLTRFLLHEPSPWTEEILRRGMIWMVALGLSIGFRYGLHISVDVINQIKRRTVLTFVRYLVFIITLVFLLILAWLGTDMAYRVRFQTFGSLDISMTWAYIAIPVGAVLSVISLIANFLPEPAQAKASRAAADFGRMQCLD